MATTVLRPGVDLSVLTADQQKALDQMRAIFKDETYPDQEDASSWFQLEDWTFLRYLRARKYHVPAAQEMLKKTLDMRRKYKPHTLSPDDPVMRAMLNMKTWFLLPPSLHHHAVQVIEAGQFDANKVDDEEDFLRYLVMADELACRDLARHGWKSHHFFLLIDFREFSLLKQMSARTMRLTRLLIEVSDAHYPEMTFKGINFDAPFVFRTPYQLLRPLLAQATLDKVQFVSDPAELDEYLSKASRTERHGGLRSEDYASLYYE